MTSQSMAMNDGTSLAPADSGRRGFCRKCVATAIGTALGLVPLGAGLAVFFDPLRRKSEARGAVRVTTLDALPESGAPRKFPVLATRVDAWNKSPETPIGAVYLRRTGDGAVHALNVVCPHAGCFVDFDTERGSFLCPCHNSAFSVEGAVNDPASPSPRAMDSLEVELRNGKEVWVRFQNFEAGRAEKVPVA